MADPLDGLNRETLANARSIQDAMADIASSASRLQRDLRGVDGNVAGLDTKFRTIRTSVSKVAQIQEDIVSSSKAASKALTQQRKNLGEVRILSLAIDKLFVAANNNTGETRENLLRQAQNLSDAKDSAQMLANDFGRMAASASALNKESLYFDALGEVLGKLSPTKVWPAS